MTIATGSAAPSRKDSGSSSGLAKDTAAAAEARNPAKVIPTWIVARKRFGSLARRARTAPVLDRCSSLCSWPSRRDTNASSVPANAAFNTTSNATSVSWGNKPPTTTPQKRATGPPVDPTDQGHDLPGRVAAGSGQEVQGW